LRHIVPATRIFHDKAIYPDDGAIVEMTIWDVPEPVPGSAHGLKYSLFYGYPGRRVVSYDNERGKGDHRHLGDLEEPYTFTTVEQMVADFLADVRKARGAA
jgi:Family of unknown function (DUF6516)